MVSGAVRIAAAPETNRLDEVSILFAPADVWRGAMEKMIMAAKPNSLVSLIDKKLDVTNFREQHWEGSFWDYLDIVHETPTVARNAFQRVYDMILSYGSESFTQFKQDHIRYHFFADPIDGGSAEHQAR